MKPTSEFEEESRPVVDRPNFLYKYCPPERVDILENLKVRFTQPAVFNDIFECFPGTDQETDLLRARRSFADQLARAFAENPHWKRRERRAFERQHIEKFKKWCKNEKVKGHHERECEEVQLYISAVTGILCLSSKWDNILMWSHYAGEHKGFVIEFAGEHPFFDLGFEKVVYSNERPLLGNRPDGMNTPEVFFTKSTDWEYEQEYRKSESFGRRRTLENGNTLVEFPPLSEIDPKNWPIHLVDIPNTAISRVIFWLSNFGRNSRPIERSSEKCALKTCEDR